MRESPHAEGRELCRVQQTWLAWTPAGQAQSHCLNFASVLTCGTKALLELMGNFAEVTYLSQPEHRYWATYRSINHTSRRVKVSLAI